MPGYYIWTIGCQMNKAESERLGGYLEWLGYEPVSRPQDADLVLMNTCVVRGNAEQRVLGELAYLAGLKKRSPRMAVAVTGCFVDPGSGEMQRRFSQVNLSFPAGKFAEFAQWARERGNGKRADAGQLALSVARPSPAAFVPVIQGCNNYCSYCIVPYRRGREHSRPLAEVVAEVKALVRRGVREVTLLGQNVNAYGRDLPESADLAGLLARLNDVEELERIRFLTSHPRDVSLEFIEAVASLDKVCEFMSLPLQSGDDSVLRKMRRDYTVEEYRRLAEALRSRVPGIGLSTDVIVGFPGETEEEFQHTVMAIRDLRFDTVHVAAYSPRPGTLAQRTMADDVPQEEKERRLRLIEGLQEGIAREVNRGLLGRRVEVLVERRNKGKWEGRTRSNKLVFFADAADRTGDLACVEVTSASPWSLQGELVSAARVGVR
ncbi:MAG: tRNA (N6-isopentenyl adenosine(37)-C2)-methylthiotransferase MiaB [Chloroflexota bacterium]